MILVVELLTDRTRKALFLAFLIQTNKVGNLIVLLASHLIQFNLWQELSHYLLIDINYFVSKIYNFNKI
jgi:hypothetical protein